MTIERCWAYAMQLKEERLQDNRKKFSMRNKLRKAAKYVVAFEKLVEVRTLENVFFSDIKSALSFANWRNNLLYIP